SEACFSIAEHLECVQRRLDRLQKIESHSATDQQAEAFVRNQLNPAWEKVRAEVSGGAGQTLSDILPQSHRCLSPSDFGFHNALLTADGQLRFFDFEYAGWDDPAKLICDFFCQPQLAVGAERWEAFAVPLASALEMGNALNLRAKLLLPAYQIKWCCIMLNDFTRTEQARREFALGDHATEERKQTQLEKAQKAFDSRNNVPAFRLAL
ncbi:MAG: aminoglycoside phosphotransferase family protein, partial [Limisphaerales bacterium]